jgi:hypothetical protein
MKKGDGAFNARDTTGMDAVHHPDMVAYVTGNAQPLYGQDAHAAAMEQFFRVFPDVYVACDPYPIQFGDGNWITVVTRVTGTFTEEMTLPDGAGRGGVSAADRGRGRQDVAGVRCMITSSDWVSVGWIGAYALLSSGQPAQCFVEYSAP